MPLPRVSFRPHAPLLWALVGLIIGYGLTEHAAAVANPIMWGLIFVAAVTGAWVARKSWRVRIYILLAVVAASIPYYQLRAARTVITLDQEAPREATVELQVIQRFALKEESGRVAGVAILRNIEGEDRAIPTGTKVNFSLKWPLAVPLDRSAVLRCKGVLAANPQGEVKGFEQYLERSHIAFSLSRGTVLAITKPAAPLMAACEALHRGASATLERTIWPKDSHLLPAMLLGDRAELTKDQMNRFVQSGTVHLLAISGMNVMAVAVVLIFLLRLLRVPHVAVGWVVVGLLFIYAQMSGATPSVMRAWGMVLLATCAWSARRQTTLFALWTLAAVLSLLIEPLSLWHAGWRLSFGVVGGLVLGMSALERMGVTQNLKGTLGGIVATLISSLVAGLAVAPMTAAYWGLAQPLGWLINAWAITLGEWVTILGTVSWVFFWLPPVCAFINEISYALLWVLEHSVAAYLTLPFACIPANADLTRNGFEAWGTLSVLALFYALARWWPKREEF